MQSGILGGGLGRAMHMSGVFLSLVCVGVMAYPVQHQHGGEMRCAGAS